MIKGIIFDMDGTLADTIPTHYQIWKQIGKEFNFPMNKNIFDSVNGMKTLNMAKKLVDKYHLKISPKTITTKKTEIALEKIKREGINLFPKTLDVLKKLKQAGFKIALGTSSNREQMELTMKPYLKKIKFDTIITAEEIKHAKPAPDIFLKCAKEMNLNPQECIVVEDAVLGIEASKNANMKVIAITNTTKRDKLQGADKIISKIEEINTKLIKNL